MAISVLDLSTLCLVVIAEQIIPVFSHQTILKKKKKKHNKLIALARSKLNIIETLISQALTNFDISQEEFSKIIYEKNNYEQIRDNIKSVKSINDLNK